MKVSQRDAKLLILLVSVALLASSYFFGYAKYKEKKQVIDKEIVALDATYQELVIENDKRAQYQKDIDELKLKIPVITVKYPADLTAEKEIMFATDLSVQNGINYTSILFTKKELFFVPTVNKDDIVENLISSTGGTVATPAPSATPVPTTTDSAETTDPAATTQNSTAQTEATTPVASFLGYKSTMTVSYKTTYKGLKDSIDFIVGYFNQKTVGNITISFDSGTGNITGDMEVTSYALDGFGTTYEDPIIVDVPIGLDNLFGSMELPTVQEADTTEAQNTTTEDTEN